MKKTLTVLMAIAFGAVAAMAETERVSVIEGETLAVTAPFEVTRFAPSNRQYADIELIGGSSIRVSGLKPGRCTLLISGENGLSHTYEITVVGNLAAVLEQLLLDLDSLPEVRAEIRGGTIRLDGEITSIGKWEYYQKVLGSYGNLTKDFVRFSPGADLLVRLTDLFRGSGLSVYTNRYDGEIAWQYDTVSIILNEKARCLTARARFLTKERLDRAESIFASIPWLVKPGAKEPREHAFTLLDEMRVADPTIRLSVAYMAVSEGELSSLGSENTLSIGGLFSFATDFKGNNDRTHTFTAGIEPVARFMANNGIGRVSDIGHLSFASWDEQGGGFKSGGKRYVKVTSGLAAELKEVDYGFIVKVKGGLTTPTDAKLTMDIEISKPIVDESGDVDKKEEHSNQTLTCPLGQTLAIGGFGEIVDDATLNGIPFVRNIPFLTWFAATDLDSTNTRKLIILVSPEVVDIGVDGKLDVDRDVTIPAKTEGAKTAEELENDRKPFHGFWRWLNWFAF